MKKLLTNYLFDSLAKTITFPSQGSLELERFLVITNVTANSIIYNFADSSKGGSVSGNVLTLTYNTGVMANTDDLQIFYEFDTPITETLPTGNEASMLARSVPTKIDRISFTNAISGSVDSSWGSVLTTGTGMTVNQTGGNLVVTSGTAARSETIIRSNATISGGVRLRAKTTLSQRIANNNFFVELVDVIGDGLAYTINSATSLTVTIPNNPFTASNVGQSVFVGNFLGTGTYLSGRYTIASVTGTSVTFTVAGFVAGSGTCSVFGWNYYQLLYTGTTATSAQFDTQRRGYNGGYTAATVSTTASGHLAIITGNDMVATLSDQVLASSAAVRATPRASRDENVPDDATLYLQLRIANGATAPASTTTWTVGYVALSNYAAQDVIVQDTRPTTNTPLPVDILRSVSLTTSTTVTATPANGTTYALITAATTNTAAVKATTGNMYELTVSNPSATPAFVKLFNKTTAPVLGTDTPVLIIPIAASGVQTVQFGAVGKRFATGIAIAVTGAIDVADTTSAPAGLIVNATYI